MKVTLDFETRSGCDLKKAGAAAYAEHPTTDILCMSWGAQEGVISTWVPEKFDYADSCGLQGLFDYILQGGIIEAHNAFFDFCIWNYVGTRRYGFPSLDPDQVVCSQAKARYFRLPESLDNLTKFMKSPYGKNEAGKGLIKALSLDKNDEEETPDPVLLAEMVKYCEADVSAQIWASRKMGDLPDREKEKFALNMRMNARGICIDVAAVEAGIRETERMKKLIVDKYEGSGIKLTQRDKVLEYMREVFDFDLPDAQKATKAAALRRPDLPENVREFLNDWVSASKTSLAKFITAKQQTNHDGFLRGGLRYAKAHTRRLGGNGVQPQNFPRSFPESCKKTGRPVMEEAVAELIAGYTTDDPNVIGDKLLGTMRGIVMVPPKYRGITADYSAIEARIVAWYAGAEKLLETFRAGTCVYCAQASSLYRREVVKGVHNEERSFGKVVILGSGYQMSWVKLFFTAYKDNGFMFTEEKAREMIGDRYEEYIDKVRKRILREIDKRTPELVLEEYEKNYKAEKKTNKEAVYSPPALPSDEELDVEDIEDEGYDSPEASVRRASVMKQFEQFGINPMEHLHELAAMCYGNEKYREDNKEIVQFWEKLENAMKYVIATRKPVSLSGGKVMFSLRDDMVVMRTSGGAEMFYHRPRLVAPKGAKDLPALERVKKSKIVFFQPDKFTGRWGFLYGGKILENLSQFTGREITEGAAVDVERQTPCVVQLIIHDEIQALVPEGSDFDLERFLVLLKAPRKGYDGLPLDAEGHYFKRYAK